MGRHRQDSYSSISWFADWLLPKVVKCSNTGGNKKEQARPTCRFEIGWKGRQDGLPCTPWCYAEEAEAPAGAVLLKCSPVQQGLGVSRRDVTDAQCPQHRSAVYTLLGLKPVFCFFFLFHWKRWLVCCPLDVLWTKIWWNSAQSGDHWQSKRKTIN